MLIIKILFLLFLANGAPVIARKLLGLRLACRLDGGKMFIDGQPWFGASKTVRGIVFSVVVTALGALLIGLTVTTGVMIAIAAMVGDLVTSFIKRRLRLPPSSMALGLDQIPESLFPILLCWETFGLDPEKAAMILCIFFIGDLVLSQVLFRFNIRNRPY